MRFFRATGPFIALLIMPHGPKMLKSDTYGHGRLTRDNGLKFLASHQRLMMWNLMEVCKAKPDVLNYCRT